MKSVSETAGLPAQESLIDKHEIAEAIRKELAEAKASALIASEAEVCVQAMLAKDFPKLILVQSFRIREKLNFNIWYLIVRHRGGVHLIDETC
jgi:hypothetical protein